MVTRSTSTKGVSATAAKKVSATNVINRKSLSVAVPPKSNFGQITKALERQLREAGCPACLSGLERLVLDARVGGIK